MPLQVIETADPLTDLVRLQTSPVYEMIISLQKLLRLSRQEDWTRAAREILPSGFWGELADLYEPFGNGSVFFELAIDYPDHEDLVGFADYVRGLDPISFMFYIVGRILTREELAATELETEAVIDRLTELNSRFSCHCLDSPLDEILTDVPAFQNRLADLWQTYSEAFFASLIEEWQPHWERALNEKAGILYRDGGQALLEHVTGRQELPDPLPPDQPVTEVVFTPVYTIPYPVYMFYGYGNVTVLFDSQRTENRRTEIERTRQEVIAVLKALSDNTRLDILRLIYHHGGEMHGKQIAAKLKLSASAVSRQLGQLKEAGLIAEESQDNRTITYRLQRDVITTLPDKLMDYLGIKY